jgi:EKC/KEOPS complex subunit CGI121/TPRKB
MCTLKLCFLCLRTAMHVNAKLFPSISLLTPEQIAESFRRFGITPTTTNLLIIKVTTPSSPLTASEIQSHLTSSIEGEQVPFEDSILQQLTDVPRVKKIYKLNSSSGGGKKNGLLNGTAMDGLSINRNGEANDGKELELLVLGAMALRGVTN